MNEPMIFANSARDALTRELPKREGFKVTAQEYFETRARLTEHTGALATIWAVAGIWDAFNAGRLEEVVWRKHSAAPPC